MLKRRTICQKMKGRVLMKKAIWNGKVIAESSNTIMVEGNQYFLRIQFIKNISGKVKCI